MSLNAMGCKDYCGTAFTDISNSRFCVVTCADDPFWWSDADLSLLQGTRLEQAVQHYNAGLQQLHNWLLRLETLYQQQQQQQQQQQLGSTSSTSSTIQSTLCGYGQSFAAVKWARSAVWSRAFNIWGCLQQQQQLPAEQPAAAAAAAPSPSHRSAPSEHDRHAAAAAGPPPAPAPGPDVVIALVPVLDMCDHHPDKKVTWRIVPAAGQQQQQQQQDVTAGSVTQQQQDDQQQFFQFTVLQPVEPVSCRLAPVKYTVKSCLGATTLQAAPLLSAI
jgi:hypothetical protein